MNPVYLPALDGLRALAALMVIAFHAWQGGTFGPGTGARLAIFGQTGVDLFFVLSGFLITRILLAARGEPGQIPRFYARRSLRIFPLYYLGLLLYLQVLPRLQGGAGLPLRQDWWYLVYLQNVPQTLPGLPWAGPDHYWSLAVEEHFYLFWPWFVVLLPRRSLPLASAALAGGALLCRWVFIHRLALGTFVATPCRLDGLALGAFLASAEAGDLPVRVAGAMRRWSAPVAVALGLLLVFLWTRLSGSGSSGIAVYKFTAIDTFYAAVLAWIVFGGSPKSAPPRAPRALAEGVLGSAPARALGRISYGIYVFHPACIGLAGTWVGPLVGPDPGAAGRGLVLLVGLAATLLLSWASYRWFEKPLLDLRPAASPRPRPRP